jgi:serine O-acetyltransferase
MNYPDRVTFKDVRFLWWSDLYRRIGKVSRVAFWKAFMTDALFKYLFWFRLASYAAQPHVKRWHPILYVVARWRHRRNTFKCGIQIARGTKIGPGLHLSHFGGIVVNRNVMIGRNCNLAHQVTLGATQRGSRVGTPVIGDNVYIGPGAMIVGSLTIGDGAAIGANAVVSRDVEDHGVAVGIPARVISRDGSAGYVNDTDYEDHLPWYDGPFREKPLDQAAPAPAGESAQ